MVASLACPSYENLYQYTRFCGTAQIPAFAFGNILV